MHQIMLQVIHSVRHRIKKSVGCFAVYGYDFMIDENMKTWLIEINVNPALTTNTDVLIQAIPPAIEEGLHIAIECFEKSRHNKKLLPLDSIKNYTILYYEKPPTSGKGHFDPSPTAIVRRSINVSPAQKVPIGNQPPEIVSVSQTVEVINLPDILRAKTDAQISRVFSKSCDIRSRNKIIKDIIISERAESTSGQIQITKLNDLNLTKRTRFFNISKIRQSSATQKVPAYITPDLENFKLKPANNVEILLSNTTPTNINFGQKMSIEQIERKSLNNTPVFSATVVGLKLH